MPFGAAARRWRRALPAVGAGRARSVALVTRTARAPTLHADSRRCARRLVRARACRTLARRHALRATASTARITRARPGVALQSRRRPRARARVVDPLAFDWPDGSLARPPVGRGGDLRAARRHVHAGRHVRRGRRAPRLPRASSGVTAIELMPVAEFPGRAQLGLRRRAAVRAGRALRHARGSEAPGGRRARARADGAARRRLQPFRPRRQLPARLRAAVLQRAPSHAVGRGDQFRRRSTAAPCATSSSTTRSTGSRNTISTGCGSTRCMRSSTTRAPDFVDRARATPCARHAGPRPPRASRARERPQRGARPRARRRPARAASRDAQWNDDFHHALHVHRDRRARRLLRRLRGSARCGISAARLAEGFAYQGEPSPFRGGAPRGERRAHAAAGRVRRLRANARPGRQPRVRRAASVLARTRAALRAAVACVLLAPAPPMLFMGEEFARDHAVPVLLRFRARARGRRDATAAAREFARIRPLSRRRAQAIDSRPECRGDVSRPASSTGAKSPRPAAREWLALLPSLSRAAAHARRAASARRRRRRPVCRRRRERCCASLDAGGSATLPCGAQFRAQPCRSRAAARQRS